MTHATVTDGLLADDVTENALAHFPGLLRRALLPVYIADDDQGIFLRHPAHGSTCWVRLDDSVPFQLYPGVPSPSSWSCAP